MRHTPAHHSPLMDYYIFLFKSFGHTFLSGKESQYPTIFSSLSLSLSMCASYVCTIRKKESLVVSTSRNF